MFGAAGERRLPRTKEEHWVEPPIMQAALHGLCPRCGAQSVFDGVADFHPKCANCEYALAEKEAGGRFAAFVTLLFAMLLMGLSAIVAEIGKPPFWLQLLIWVPITIVGVIGTVRFAKAGLLALRYAKAKMNG